MYEHHDALADLNANVPLGWKLAAVHRAVKQRFPFVERIAVASLDRPAGLVKTFLASDGGAPAPLVHYEAKLEEAPSLVEMLHVGRPRVVNDLGIFAAGEHEHTKKIGAQGFASSYTFAIYHQGTAWGFIFFNAREKGCFEEKVLLELDLFAHLIAEMVLLDDVSVRLMVAAVTTANQMVHVRDPETGSHLDRMSRTARLIAHELARSGKYALDDDAIERIFLFSPLHDLGKIGIPDRILLKPAPLTDSERAVMKTHAAKGAAMIDSVLENFGLQSFPGADMLRNIAELHHEALDGSGYPRGLKGAEIPLEARVVAVADVFDALTSRRPYKKAWTNEEALAELGRLGKTRFDADCVEALSRSMDKVRQIQAQFPDRGGPRG